VLSGILSFSILEKEDMLNRMCRGGPFRGEGVIFLIPDVELRRESGERTATGQEVESRR